MALKYRYTSLFYMLRQPFTPCRPPQRRSNCNFSLRIVQPNRRVSEPFKFPAFSPRDPKLFLEVQVPRSTSERTSARQQCHPRCKRGTKLKSQWRNRRSRGNILDPRARTHATHDLLISARTYVSHQHAYNIRVINVRLSSPLPSSSTLSFPLSLSLSFSPSFIPHFHACPRQ